MPSVNIISNSDEHLASHRMRCVIPTSVLNAYTEYKAEITGKVDTTKDINIFHKHFNAEEVLSDAILSSDLTKLMFDVCDDHFDRDNGEFYEKMCELAHVITCNTANMQRRIYDVTGRLAQICSDPISFPRHDPLHTTAPNILWHGHCSNLFSIVPYIKQLKDDLTIITNTKIPTVECRSKFWKPGLVEDIIELYDVVIIPKITTPEAKCKSPNRAVDALHAGRFVIAESEEVYGELIDFIFLGDIMEGLEFYKNNPEKVLAMIQAGQQYVLDTYNHKRICEQWVSAFQFEDFSRYEGQ